MKDAIKKGFEEAISKRSKADADHQAVQAKRHSEREQFEQQWAALFQSLITPALEEVDEQVLEPAGWTTRIESVLDEKTRMQVGIKFVIFKGDMRGMGGLHTRPELSFRSDIAANQIWVHMSSASQAGSDGNFKLEQVTADLVQEKALKFFQRLTGETSYRGY